MGRILVPYGAGVSPSMYGQCSCPSVWGFGQPKHPCAGRILAPCMVWGWGQPEPPLWEGSWSRVGLGSAQVSCMESVLVPLCGDGVSPNIPVWEGSWPPVWCGDGVSPSIPIWEGSSSLCGAGVTLSLLYGKGLGQPKPPVWGESWPLCGDGDSLSIPVTEGSSSLCGVGVTLSLCVWAQSWPLVWCGAGVSLSLL